MSNKDKDYIVVLGFDDSQVKKGMKALDKAVQRNRRLESKTQVDKVAKGKFAAELKYQRIKEQWSKKDDIAANRRSRREQAASKQQQQAFSKLRKEAVSNLTNREGSGESLKSMRDYYRAQEQAESRINKQRARERQAQQRFENRRERQLESINSMFGRTQSLSRHMPRGTSEDLMGRQSALRTALRGATSSNDIDRLSAAQRQLARDTQAAVTAARQQERAMNAQKFAANSLRSSVMNLARSFASVYAAIEGFRGFYRIGTEFDSMRAALLAASGSAKVADENFQFLLDTSKNLGVDLQGGVAGFNKLGIAARAAGFETKQIQEMYLGVAESASAFQLDPTRQSLVFLAISQMASKAKISMEEVQRQLGDTLPTAMQAMRMAYSDFLGKDVSPSELIKAIESGNVMSKDVILGFTQYMRVLAREGGALEAAMKKVRSEQTRAAVALQENVMEGFNQSAPMFASAWREVTSALEAARPTFVVFGKVFGATFKVIAMAVRSVMPIINLVATVINNVIKTFEGLSNLIANTSKKASKDLNVWERAALLLAAAFNFVAGAIYAALEAYEDLAKLMTITADDSTMSAILKGTASWVVALLAAGAAARLILGTFKGILSIVKTLSGYNLVKKVLGKKEDVNKPNSTRERKPLSSRGDSDSKKSGMGSKVKGFVGNALRSRFLGPIVGLGAMEGVEEAFFGPENKASMTDWSFDSLYNRFFNGGHRGDLQANSASLLNNMQMANRGSSSSSGYAQPINVSVEVDGRELGRTVEPFMLQAFDNKLKREVY